MKKKQIVISLTVIEHVYTSDTWTVKSNIYMYTKYCKPDRKQNIMQIIWPHIFTLTMHAWLKTSQSIYANLTDWHKTLQSISWDFAVHTCVWRLCSLVLYMCANHTVNKAQLNNRCTCVCIFFNPNVRRFRNLLISTLIKRDCEVYKLNRDCEVYVVRIGKLANTTKTENRLWSLIKSHAEEAGQVSFHIFLLRQSLQRL